MKFSQYALASTVVTAGLVGYSYATRVQFYPAVIYLVTSKPAIMVLFNQAFVLTILLGQLTNKIFLGRLREAEREICYENLRYTFTEMCLALSTFREEMSLNVVVMFTALLFSKVFHWLCEARVEHLEQAQETSRLSHFRTVSLMAVLFVADLICGWTSLHLVQVHGASVQVFFGFEYVLMGIKVVEVFVKYCLAAIDSHFIQGQWYNKSLYELYLKLVIDVAQLFVNIIFFAIIFTYYGVPLHLMRQLYIAVKNVHERLSHFWRFRRITANLHERFPNATEEDLAATDRICIICREEMVAGTGIGSPKKLAPCGHIFHFYCLRNWLERQLKCPTCRSDISSTRNPQPPPAPAVPGGAGQEGGEEQPQVNPPQVPNEPPQDMPQPRQHPLPQRFQFPPAPGAGRGGEGAAPSTPPQVPRGPGEGTEGAGQDRRAGNFEPPFGRAPGFGFAGPIPPPAPPGPSSSQDAEARRNPFPFGMPGGIPPGLGFGVPPPPLGFPMGLAPTQGASGVPLYGSQGEMPSVAQYIQSQIEILQLLLQVYQAQVEAAEATRSAALAAMQVREFRERQENRENARDQPPPREEQSQEQGELREEKSREVEVESKTSSLPTPAPAPVSSMSSTEPESGSDAVGVEQDESKENKENEVESKPSESDQLLSAVRSRAAQAALLRRQREEAERQERGEN